MPLECATSKDEVLMYQKYNRKQAPPNRSNRAQPSYTVSRSGKNEHRKRQNLPQFSNITDATVVKPIQIFHCYIEINYSLLNKGVSLSHMYIIHRVFQEQLKFI